MGSITVIEPGMQTTVQDLGRCGHAALGVPPGGAFDALSLRAGNRLVGNPDNSAALECTLIGPTLKFEQEAAVALTGAEPHARELMPWTRFTVRAGSTLRIGTLGTGARAYLCIAGGFNTPGILGSASTLLSAGLGGHEGRALKAGDKLDFSDPPSPLTKRHTRLATDLRKLYTEHESPRTLRATDGPHPHAFNPTATAAFWSATFRVSNQSNRTGVRLDGPTFSTRTQGDMVSEGMPVGAIQITPSGQPIALGVDGPTTGGYPVIATIATVDLHLLGQVRPNELIRFQRVSPQEARDALIDRECEWDERMP